MISKLRLDRNEANRGHIGVDHDRKWYIMLTFRKRFLKFLVIGRDKNRAIISGLSYLCR
jgi:hypothetical protein